MKKKTKNKHQCDCFSCREYDGRPLTPQEKKKEEMAFLKSVGVKVKKTKNFEDALKMALR